AGAGGADYMDMECYRRAGVSVGFQDFRHPVYPQAYSGFEPHLSAVDLLLNCGAGSIARVRETRQAA
ncbi:MAG: WbqC family protein, partial [Candidatus Rokubacteria bacterium]|nr:WbqC family protein [Candidatus Rokubacteria bacterium]